MSKLLKRWNFTPQKPAFRAYEQSPRQVRKWLQEQYPKVKRKAQRRQGTILWLGEAGIRSRHHAGTTYAPKEKTPVIERTVKRFHLNMISATTNKGKLVFMVVDGRFNGGVFLMFLLRLIRSTDSKVFLIADSHPLHLEKKVTRWLKEHKE